MQGACKGDSGGPLQFYNPIEDRYYQVAIVHGSVADCGSRDWPTVFVGLDDPEILSFVESLITHNPDLDQEQPPASDETSKETFKPDEIEEKELAIDPEPDWYLLGSGWRESLLLYNLRSGEQCFASEQTNPILGYDATHIKALKGVPIFCRVVDKSCFKFSATRKSWLPIAAPPKLSFSANMAFVPRKGLVLFNSNLLSDFSKTDTWILEDPDADWMAGPSIIGCNLANVDCHAQVNETTTVFLGGHRHPRGIVTYDWPTNRCTKLETELPTEHTEDCVAIKDKDGNSLVVAVSANGDNGTGRGLEIWNPGDGTFQREPIAFGEQNKARIHHHAMAVVNNGYDLLLLAEYLQGDTEYGNLTSLTQLVWFKAILSTNKFIKKI